MTAEESTTDYSELIALCGDCGLRDETTIQNTLILLFSNIRAYMIIALMEAPEIGQNYTEYVAMLTEITETVLNPLAFDPLNPEAPAQLRDELIRLFTPDADKPKDDISTLLRGDNIPIV